MNQILYSLQKWFIQEGITTKSITIKSTDQNQNGVFAIENIPQNEIIIRIPIHLIIFSNDLLTYHYKRLIKYYPHIFNIQFNTDAEFNALVYFLLTDAKDDQNRHAPYFNYVQYIAPKNILTQNYESQDINLNKTINKMRIGLQLNYGYFQTLFKEKLNQELKYEEFLDAYQFVMTRCFGGDKHTPSSCLVPFGDMLNHHDKSQVKHFIQGEYLCFLTIKQIKKDEEIYNFFGEYDNSFLFCWYGFMYEENIFDKVYLYIDTNDQLQQVSCSRFEKCNYVLKKYKICQSLLKKIGKLKYNEIIDQAKLISKNQLNSTLLISQLQVLNFQLNTF